MTNVWRVRMKSGAAGVDHHGAREFAIRKGWVGAGWALGTPCPIEEGERDYRVYLSEAVKFYPGDRSISKVAKILGEEIQIDDYCWMYETHTGEYYCGHITGEFEYRHTGNFDEYDLHIVRKCRWALAGTADAVPGVVRRALAGPFGAIGKIVTDSQTAIASAKAALGEPDAAIVGSFFSAASPEDLEDVVALYLQAQGWMVLPSTAKASMASYEFVLVHETTGERAGVQVKSGGVSVLNQPIAKGFNKFFVFLANPNACVQGDTTRIHQITPRELEQFARKNFLLVPSRLQKCWKPIS